MPSSNPVSAHLRDQVEAISSAWEHAVLHRLPHLRRLERAALIDHVPELLYGLAAWVEGDTEAGRRGFEALALGHAIQRLSHGIDLETLSTEYQILRNVILESLLVVESDETVRRCLVQLDEGIDYAVNEAVRRYSTRRDEIRERFIGILGHDLRNPLNAVSLAAAHVVATPCDDPKHVRMGATIQRSADRMMRMISDVIDFAHAHLGHGIPAVPTPEDMGAICEDAAQELRIAHPDRTILVTRSGDLAGSWDHDRVMQALSNLIGNALQHGTDPIVVSATESEDHSTVFTRVTNGGTPIPRETLDRLFDPFRHGSDPKIRVRTNLGLGLYIVQQIAIAHGGVCSATSDATATTFEIAWPRVPHAIVSDRG